MGDVTGGRVIQRIGLVVRLLLICGAVALVVRGIVTSARMLVPASQMRQELRHDPAPHRASDPASPKKAKTRRPEMARVLLA
jgi:hypothetical protein